MLKKIICLLVAVSFLVSDVAFALETNQTRLNTYINLAPPLELDDIADGTSHLKYLTLARMNLDMDLLRLDKVRDIDWKTDPKEIRGAFAADERFRTSQTYAHDKNLHPTTIICHFNEVGAVDPKHPSHIFVIPVTVEKEGKRYDYRLLFSTARNKDSHFPSVLCTAEWLEKAKNTVAMRDKLPERREVDKEAIERYIQHEKAIDGWIAERMQDKNNYIAMEPPVTSKFLSIAIPGELDNAFGEQLKRLLETKKVVLIKVKKGDKKPSIYEKGKKIEVSGHVSQHAIYVFVDEKEGASESLDEVFENLRLYIQKGRWTIKGEERVGFFAHTIAKSMTHLYINPSLYRGIGIICALDYEVTEDGRTVNNMDRVYQEAYNKTYHDIIKMPLVKQLQDKLVPTNLDTNLKTRDYAAAEGTGLRESAGEILSFDDQVKEIRDFLKANDLAPSCLHVRTVNKTFILDLSDANLVDIRPFSKWVNLTELYLSNTQVSGINFTSKLVNLTRLNIASTPTRDLRPLYALAHLTDLTLGPGISDDDIYKLFQANPNRKHLKVDDVGGDRIIRYADVPAKYHPHSPIAVEAGKGAGSREKAVKPIEERRLPDGFLTQEEATKRLNALSTIGDLDKLKTYYNRAIKEGYDHQRILKDLGPELAQMADILRKARPVDELNELLAKQGLDIKVKQLDILRAASELVLQFLPEKKNVDNIQRLKEIKVIFAKYPYISKLLIEYFETRFDPAKSLHERGESAGNIRIELLDMIDNINDRENHNILFYALSIMVATTKTDYYVEDRTCLTLRMTPRALVMLDRTKTLVRTPPYAMIWVHVPYGAYGAHSRYTDVARGGLRSVRSDRTQLRNRILSECIALSFTQNNKHIDIPEGGSKGAFIYEMGLNPVAAAIGYSDGLVNCMMPNERIAVSSDGQAIDPLELGPDEGTADIGSLMTVRAWMKGLEDWRLLITGKLQALGGTSHMKNNLLTPPEIGNRVTSQGVMKHAFPLVRYLREEGIIESKEDEPVRFSVTSGFRGDVGSGLLEIPIRHYGNNAKMLTFGDTSAVVFDPEGLDHEALLKMYREELPAKDFPIDKLHKGGFVVKLTKKGGTGVENYVVLGPETLSHMNTKAFEPELLEKLGADARFREQANLKPGEPLVTVLNRDKFNHPAEVKVHGWYLRDVAFFVAKSDMLLTGGGVKDSINDNNWQLFLDLEGNPTAPSIVHGANVFISDQAIKELEAKGVVIEPDEKANSLGVEISSRMEIDFNMLFEMDEIRPELMKSYFEQVLSKCLENAERKFWALRIEAEDHPYKSVGTYVSPRISEEIIRFADLIRSSHLVAEKESDYSEVVLNCLKEYFPDVSRLDKRYKRTLTRVFDRMPSNRIKAIVAKLVAKEAVLNLGIGAIDRIAKATGKSEIEVIEKYLDIAERLNINANIRKVLENKEGLSPSEQIKQLRALRGEANRELELALSSKNATGKSAVATVTTPYSVYNSIVSALKGKEVSPQEQFGIVYQILKSNPPSKYPDIAKALDKLRHLVDEKNPASVMEAINKSPVTPEEKQFLLLAFFTPGEGSGMLDYAGVEEVPMGVIAWRTGWYGIGVRISIPEQRLSLEITADSTVHLAERLTAEVGKVIPNFKAEASVLTPNTIHLSRKFLDGRTDREEVDLRNLKNLEKALAHLLRPDKPATPPIDEAIEKASAEGGILGNEIALVSEHYIIRKTLSLKLIGIMNLSDFDKPVIIKTEKYRQILPELAYEAANNPNMEFRKTIQDLILRTAPQMGVIQSSIRRLYESKYALEETKKGKFTLPSMNLRCAAFDEARIIFEKAKELKVGAFQIEIAPTEIGYTGQSPKEFASSVVAGAIATGYTGPVFLKLDHLRMDPKKYKKDGEKEIQRIFNFMKDALDNGFYAIDIDASVLEKNPKEILDPVEQQRDNFVVSARLVEMARAYAGEKGLDIALGVEVGEVGEAYITEEHIRAFLNNLKDILAKRSKESGWKIKMPEVLAIPSGTPHGGLRDPKTGEALKDVTIAFDLLEKAGIICKEYGMFGPVQHGASKLPIGLFNMFPIRNVMEIHLATAMSDIEIDRILPDEIREKMLNEFVTSPAAAEVQAKRKAQGKEPLTAEALRKNTERRKLIKDYKRSFWDVPDEKKALREKLLGDLFGEWFKLLGVVDTKALVGNLYFGPSASLGASESQTEPPVAETTAPAQTPTLAEPAAYLTMTPEQLKAESGKISALKQKLENQSRSLAREMQEVPQSNNHGNATQVTQLENRISELNKNLRTLDLEIARRQGYSTGEGLGGGVSKEPATNLLKQQYPQFFEGPTETGQQKGAENIIRKMVPGMPEGKSNLPGTSAQSKKSPEELKFLNTTLEELRPQDYMAAPGSALSILKKNGVVTVGDLLNFKKTHELTEIGVARPAVAGLEKAIADYRTRLLSSQSEDKHNRTTTPGKSPEDAMRVILLAKLFEKDSFTLQEYLAAYEEAVRLFGFEPLAKNPESTARRDLAELVRQGYLTIDTSSRPYKYRLTADGYVEINNLPLRGYKTSGIKPNKNTILAGKILEPNDARVVEAIAKIKDQVIIWDMNGLQALNTIPVGLIEGALNDGSVIATTWEPTQTKEVPIGVIDGIMFRSAKVRATPAYEMPKGIRTDNSWAEPPVAGMRTKAKLTDDADHEIVNALIRAIINYSKSEEGKKDVDSFVYYEPMNGISLFGKKCGVFWLGSKFGRSNKSFADIFEKLARVYAKENNITDMERAKLAVAKYLVKEANLESKIVVDSSYLKRLESQLALQAEHFGVEIGQAYIMRAYHAQAYSQTVFRHIRIELQLHHEIIKRIFREVGGFSSYRAWRNGEIKFVQLEEGLYRRFREIIDVNLTPRTMSYAEFVQWAHDIAETACPVGKLIPMDEKEVKAHLRNIIPSNGYYQHLSEAPVAGMRSASSASEWKKPSEEETIAVPIANVEPVSAPLDIAEILAALPEKLRVNGFDINAFIAEISALVGQRVLINGNGALIFSERVTFNNGLGVLLPKLAQAGIKIAVIAPNEQEKAKIEELNKEVPREQQIRYADSVAEARSRLPAARYYYFKVAGDPDADLQGVTTFDITQIVKRIIEAIGRACGIIKSEEIEQLHKATQEFKRAA